MSKAVTRRGIEILALVRPIHGLQEEVLKIQSLELRRMRPGLRKDELQLVAFALLERNARLGTDANPIDATRRRARAVGFQRDHKAARVKRFDKRRIELQRRLAAGANDVGLGALRVDGCSPDMLNSIGKRLCAFELASAGTVIAHKVRVAEAAEGTRLVARLPGPEIASRKAQENGRPPNLRALT